MSISGRKKILVLQWCSFMLSIVTLAYAILHAIQWDEGEILEILQNIILKSAVCVIMFFVLIFQGSSLTLLSSEKTRDNESFMEVENEY